jgi:hypothetical protein
LLVLFGEGGDIALANARTIATRGVYRWRRESSCKEAVSLSGILGRYETVIYRIGVWKVWCQKGNEHSLSELLWPRIERRLSLCRSQHDDDDNNGLQMSNPAHS